MPKFLLLLIIFLSGCRELALDASSNEALWASVEQIVLHDPAMAVPLEQAIIDIRDFLATNSDGGRLEIAGLGDSEQARAQRLELTLQVMLHGKSATEVVRIAEQMKPGETAKQSEKYIPFFM